MIIRVQATDAAVINSLAGGVGLQTGEDDSDAGLGFAAGAAVAVNQIQNEVLAAIDGSKVVAPVVEVAAVSEAQVNTLAAGGARAQTLALGGSVALNMIDNTVGARIAGGADVSSSGTVRVQATDEPTIRSLAGAVAVADFAA